jgi:sugar phosphate isomerase/epimerase
MENSRRTFLKATGAAAALTAVDARSTWAAKLRVPVGIQLYSVREQMPKDFEGTLKQVKAAGYEVVEAAGYFNKSASEWKSAMDAAGLKCLSTHHALTDLRAKGDELIEYGKKIGLEYMVCSWAGVHRDPKKKGELTLDDWRYVADELNKVGAKVKAAGMQFGYHNHTPEFGNEGGVVFYDELLKGTDPKLVVFEMDCGWVVAAGKNPVDYLRKTPERFPLLHIKDFVKGSDGKEKPVVMGHGYIDYKPILKAATGLKQYFIEQEAYTTDKPYEELREDTEFMKKLDV